MPSCAQQEQTVPVVVTLVLADATAVATAEPIACAVDCATASALPPPFTCKSMYRSIIIGPDCCFRWNVRHDGRDSLLLPVVRTLAQPCLVLCLCFGDKMPCIHSQQPCCNWHKGMPFSYSGRQHDVKLHLATAQTLQCHLTRDTLPCGDDLQV